MLLERCITLKHKAVGLDWLFSCFVEDYDKVFVAGLNNSNWVLYFFRIEDCIRKTVDCSVKVSD